ncbi:3-methyl-2-oxobutanoate hydroxymethyltransferase [Candidatus Heimdallarchaeota archaeon B3_Heim]|nr:MAG: 3-methyl-2-oxobutanoate hydroxymethyltransferase [Candidatus Heimdallarchaeota archaeon B3_Heim]
MKKKTVLDIMEMYDSGKKITMLTAYDYVMASILNEAETDMLLVGDTMGMVVYGQKTTLQVTLEDSIRHTQAVARGAKSAMVIGDLPFGTFQVSREEAIKNSVKLMQLGRAEAIKLEGGSERISAIEGILDAGIPVMGHLGLTPQSFHKFGGFKVQGRSEETAKKLVEEARALEEAGIFSLVLEAIPWEVAKEITESISIPTIGIGAGPYCSGQVLVTYDMLGYFDFKAKFVKRYANLKDQILSAIQEYNKEVRNKSFPDLSYSYEMPK